MTAPENKTNTLLQTHDSPLYHNTTALATLSSSQTYSCLLKEITAPQVILEEHFPAHTETDPEGSILQWTRLFPCGKRNGRRRSSTLQPPPAPGTPGTEAVRGGFQ